MTHPATTPAAGGEEIRDFASGTPERLIQRLEDAASGGLFICDADREEAVEIAAEEMARAAFTALEPLSVRSFAAGTTGVVPPGLREKLRLTMDYHFGKGRNRDTVIEHVLDRLVEELVAAAPEAPTPVERDRERFARMAADGHADVPEGYSAELPSRLPLVRGRSTPVTSAPGAVTQGKPAAQLEADAAIRLQWGEGSTTELAAYDIICRHIELTGNNLDGYDVKGQADAALTIARELVDPHQSPAAPRSADLPGREAITRLCNVVDCIDTKKAGFLSLMGADVADALRDALHDVRAFLTPSSPTQEMRAAEDGNRGGE